MNFILSSGNLYDEFNVFILRLPLLNMQVSGEIIDFVFCYNVKLSGNISSQIRQIFRYKWLNCIDRNEFKLSADIPVGLIRSFTSDFNFRGVETCIDLKIIIACGIGKERTV